MTTSDPTISALRSTQRTLRFERKRIEVQLKNLERDLREQAEPGPRALIQEQIAQHHTELNQTIDLLQETATALDPLLEAEAGKDGRLTRDALLLLKGSFHFSDDDIATVFVEPYKELRADHPEWNLHPLRLLSDRREMLMALALVEGCRVLPGEEREHLLARIPSAKLSSTATASIKVAVENQFAVHSHRVGQTTAWIANIAAARGMVADIPADFNVIEADCVHEYAQHLIDAGAPTVSYPLFSTAYFERKNKELVSPNPYLISCVAKVDPVAGSNNRPMTAGWLCGEGIPTKAQVDAFNAVIARTVHTMDVRALPGAFLGQAPFGCEIQSDSPIAPGHNKLMAVIGKVCEHLNLFMHRLPEDTSKDDATGANAHWYLRKYLVWFGGLGLAALRMVMDAFKRQGVEGADHYGFCDDVAEGQKETDLTQVLTEIASTNADPASGFGVLRPDLTDYLPAIEKTGLVPSFTALVACMTMFKYVSYGVQPPTESEPTYRHVLIIQYGDHPAVVVPIARGFLEQTLSEGEGYRGNGALRIAVMRHLKWNGITNDAVLAIIGSLFATLRPKDFPMREPLSANPFLLVSPCPSTHVVITPSDSCPVDKQPFFNVRCRPSLYRFNPQGGSLFEDWATEAETLLYLFPFATFDATVAAEFLQSIPETIVPQKFSATVAPYLRNINDLGHPQGLLDALDVLVGVDLARAMFPDAPVVVEKAGHEIFLFTNVPDDASDAENTFDQGKSTFALAVAGTGNLALEVNPVSGSDSAPTLRVLLAEFHKCDGTFFVDEALDISNPNHPLSNRALKTIATAGKGPSPGIAGGNGKPLVYRHPVSFTRKYPLSDNLDLVSRSMHMYHFKLTGATKMTSEEFAFFSSMRFRVAARLNFLAWMHVSGFAKSIYAVKPKRVATRFEGHDGIAGALLGNGTTTDADVSHYAAYMAAANGEKCQKMYAMALESGTVEAESGRTIVHVKDWFEQCDDFTLGKIANELLDHRPMTPRAVWESVVTKGRTEDFHRIASANGFTKVRGGARTLPKQFLVAAKEGQLTRDDGWRATVKTVTVPSGARTEYVFVCNDLTTGKPDDYSEAKVIEMLGILRKKYDKKP